MKTDTTEKGLEAHITQHLCLVNAFEERHFSQYNRADCVDEDALFNFLQATQEKEVMKLQTIHGSNFRSKVLYRLNNQIKTFGIIEVLRKGITDNNIKLVSVRPTPLLLGKTAPPPILAHRGLVPVSV